VASVRSVRRVWATVSRCPWSRCASGKDLRLAWSDGGFVIRCDSLAWWCWRGGRGLRGV